MIAYMWQTGNDYAGSIFYLLVYNLMFILPLIVIFIAAYFGLKSRQTYCHVSKTPPR